MTRIEDPVRVLERLAPVPPVDTDGLGRAHEIWLAAVAGDAVAPPAPVASAASRLGRWALVACLAGAVVVVPTAGDERAAASWSPVPTEVSRGEAEALAAECASGFAEVQLAPSTPPLPVDSLELVLSERRGDQTFTVVADDTAVAHCMGDGSAVGAGLTWLALYDEVGQDAVDVLYQASMMHTSDDEGQEYIPGTGTTAIVGRVGADVVSVDVEIADGTIVTATVANGYWAAWWPGYDDFDEQVTARLADGTTIGPFSAQQLYEDALVTPHTG